MFDPVDPKQALPDVEKGILQYWQEEDVFKRSMKQRSSGTGDLLDGKPGRGEQFSFYDGPPFATGLPHYGHLLAGTIKDVIPRYQTMRGKYVERRFGWDCHGLPVENLVEKENNLKDRRDIEAIGTAKFNALCRSSVQRYTKEWREVVERMGRWVDMDWDYRTMDPEFMESIWWVFGELQKKKLIYEGHKPMHICPRCGTPLSNFEVTQGYKDITDYAATVKFQLKDDPKTFVLAWTTTPWTLPGNLLLAVGSKIKYVTVSHEGSNYIVARPQVENVFKGKEYQVTGEISAKDLVGKKYTPLFPYFAKDYKNAFRIVTGDFVTTDEGTGIVHIAPGFGEDDFRTGEKEKLPLLQHVTMEGTFVSEVTDFAGELVKPKDDSSKMDRKIAEWLEKNGKLFKAESFKHTYPHCWRCDTPLLNYATSSWFVAVEKLKAKMLANNAKTKWVPSHIRDGRFGKWLENARDWAISRNRYWGTPLPIWRSAETGDMEVIASRSDLMAHAPARFTQVTAVRHGQSEGNLIPLYQGVPPGTSLTDLGKKQAQAVGASLKDQAVDIIYSSPLARAQETAAQIAKQTGAKVIVDDRLAEVTFGDYEGKTVDFDDLSFVKARRAHKLKEKSPERIYHFPGMETWDDVQKRVADFLKEKLPMHRGEHIVIVTHADPLQNVKYFFNREDPLKISHQPYPRFAEAHTFFWDQHRNDQMDLHKDAIDDIVWPGSKSKASVSLTMVRHGKTDWNASGKLQGHEDIPLNEEGQKQADAVAKKLKKEKFDVIITSDLKRARQTADAIAKELGMKNIVEWKELRERDIGEWKGSTVEAVLEKYPSPYEIDTFHHLTPKGGESLTEFLQRSHGLADRLSKEFAGKRVLMVTHSGVMCALRMVTDGWSLMDAVEWDPKNTETISVTVNPLLRRIPEVLDCWFESGSMPYAQNHFPFSALTGAKKKDVKPVGFPADFIAEGIDQTRGWFYTLTVLSTALFDEPVFKHCVVNGTVLAEDGKKMSKRLQNYPDPMKLVEKFGADAIRFTLMSSPAVRGEDLRMSEKLTEESVRQVLLPLWNIYSFFVTYANAAKFQPGDTRRHSTHPLDRWIRAEVQDLVNRMTKQLDGYDLSATCAEIHDTIDALTNWYVRLSRRRFAGKSVESDDASVQAGIDVSDDDQHDALQTLFDVLLTFNQVLAPFCPFITEAIYLNLAAGPNGSIHLTDWPEVRKLTDEEQRLLTKTRLLRIIVSLGLSVRSDQKLKVRQPLSSATIAVPPALMKGAALSAEDIALIKQELNVKAVELTEDPGALAEAYVQVDARKAGPRLGGRVQEIIRAGKNGEFTVRDDGSILILDEVLTPEEAQVIYRGKEGQTVAANKGVVVSLNTQMSDELESEGIARDLIRAIQKLRKETGLQFTDDINLSVEGVDDVIGSHKDLISRETRSTFAPNDGEKHTMELGERKVTIAFTKR